MIPEGKFIFGTVKVGERGQIVIPRDARKTFGIEPGDTLMVLGDTTQGIGIVKVKNYEKLMEALLSGNGDGQNE